MEPDSRELSWDGCVNARDLGGLGQIRPGAVIRMEQARRLTEAGWAAVWAYGVRTVLTAVNELLASRGTTIEASPTSTITTLTMPDDLLGNGLSGTELAALRTRLTA